MPRIIKSTQIGNMYAAYMINQSALEEVPVPRSADEAKEQILRDAVEEAGRIAEAANGYADKLIQDTNRQLAQAGNQIRAESREEGYRQGLEEGQAAGYEAGFAQGLLEAAQAKQELLDEIAGLLQNIEQQKTDVLDRFSADLQKLAFAIARKVIKTELKTNEAVMSSIVTGAMEAYRNQEWLKIYVSGNTAEILNNSDPPILTKLREISQTVKIVVCPDMKDDDCIMETPDQMIEAGTDTQLKKIEDALMI